MNMSLASGKYFGNGTPAIEQTRSDKLGCSAPGFIRNPILNINISEQNMESAQLEGDNMTMFDDSTDQTDATTAVKRKIEEGAGRAAKVIKTEEGIDKQESTEQAVNGDSSVVNGAENGNEKPEETPETIVKEEEVDEPLVVEDLFSVFVSARRRNFRLPDEVVQEIKNEFAAEGVTVIDTFSTNNYNFNVRVSKADEAENLIKKFHKTVVAGLELFVKDKTPRAGQYQVRIRSTNCNVCFDYEFADEVSEVLKKMEIDFHNCKSIKGQKEVEINLYHKEDIDEVLEKFNNVNFGYVDIVAESFSEDSKPQAAENELTDASQIKDGDLNDSTASQSDKDDSPTSEPFVFAAMKTNTDVFNTKNMKLVSKAFQEESIEVTRSNTASGGKFAYFFVKTWDDADKFLSKYYNKLINGMLINFEKGSRRSSNLQNNYEQNKNTRQGPNSGAPRGGPTGNRGGAGNWNRNSGGGYGGNRGGGSYGGPHMWGGNRGGGGGYGSYGPHYGNRGGFGGQRNNYYRGGW